MTLTPDVHQFRTASKGVQSPQTIFE
jgi:hypothetical protein